MREYSAKNKRPQQDIRSDASANRQALVVAARRLFAQHGPEISLTDIAREAKVSRPTFYRNFPDRTSIIAAVFHHNLGLLEHYAQKLEGSPDAFIKLLKAIVNQQIEFRSLIPYLSNEDYTLVERLEGIFESPIANAKANGLLKPDFDTKNDLPLLILMLGGALLHNPHEDREERIQRALDFVMEGLKP